MTETYDNIDPAIFEETRSLEFEMELTTLVGVFVTAQETLDRYNPDGTPKSGQLGGTIGDIIDKFSTETGANISLGMGAITVRAIGDETSEPVTISMEELSVEGYSKAALSRETASTMLAGYMLGYQAHVQAQLEAIVDPGVAPEKAWELVWKKLQATIKPMGGGNLVDVVDYFDELIELRYPLTFDPMDSMRGIEARLDIAARAFYTVMQPHLKRATMRRGEDNWSG